MKDLRRFADVARRPPKNVQSAGRDGVSAATAAAVCMSFVTGIAASCMARRALTLSMRFRLGSRDSAGRTRVCRPADDAMDMMGQAGQRADAERLQPRRRK